MTSVTSSTTFSLAYLEALRDVQYQMVAALSFLVWDALSTFEDEVEYIWQMRPCVYKWLYFYFRYFLLGAHIFHVAISPILSSGRVSDSLCIAWYRYVVVIMQGSICMIDYILAILVYALFDRNRRVGIFLVTLILLELALAGTHAVQRSRGVYFETCMLPLAQTDFASAHVIIILIVQSIIMGMLIFKHYAVVKLGSRRPHLLSHLMKDATTNYVTVSLLSTISLIFCGFGNTRVIAVFHWSIGLYSFIGSRLILNVERFARKNPLEEEYIFTSQISLH